MVLVYTIPGNNISDSQPSMTKSMVNKSCNLKAVIKYSGDVILNMEKSKLESNEVDEARTYSVL